jgi:hypothetical protein
MIAGNSAEYMPFPTQCDGCGEFFPTDQGYFPFDADGNEDDRVCHECATAIENKPNQQGDRDEQK